MIQNDISSASWWSKNVSDESDPTTSEIIILQRAT